MGRSHVGRSSALNPFTRVDPEAAVQVTVGHSVDNDGVVTEYSVNLNDDIADYNPLRTSELCTMAAAMFRATMAEHEPVQHDRPAE